MNNSDEPTTDGSTSSAPPIRILAHNLIDICDLLGTTFSFDGVAVRFSRRDGGVRREWSGQLGDWLVADSDSSWRVVPDGEFALVRSESDQERSEPAPRTATTSGDRSGVLAS